MNKLFFTIIFLVIFSCKENDLPKKLNKEIFTSNLIDIEDVLKENRPITSYFLDSVVGENSSIYFKDVKNVFHCDYFFIGESKGGMDDNEYFFSYRFEGLKLKFTFVYMKKNKKWILKGFKVLKDHTP